jgi:hypothetical protein
MITSTHQHAITPQYGTATQHSIFNTSTYQHINTATQQINTTQIFGWRIDSNCERAFRGSHWISLKLLSSALRDATWGDENSIVTTPTRKLSTHQTDLSKAHNKSTDQPTLDLKTCCFQSFNTSTRSMKITLMKKLARFWFHFACVAW